MRIPFVTDGKQSDSKRKGDHEMNENLPVARSSSSKCMTGLLPGSISLASSVGAWPKGFNITVCENQRSAATH